MQPKDHWEKVYSTKAADEVSWFQEHAELSLKLIRDADVPSTASIIDVGGGASTLVDDLLANGYRNLTVLDLSAAALATAKTRLGSNAASVRWLKANVIEAALPERSFDVWHDRAVFHFLTSEEDRRAGDSDHLRRGWPGEMQRPAGHALWRQRAARRVRRTLSAARP